MRPERSRLVFASAAAALFLWALAARATQAPAGPAKVNINQASAAQLAFLPRVGAKAAARVVEYRKSHGPFQRPEELMEVKGIGEKLFLKLKPYLAVSGPTTLSAKVRLASDRKGGTAPVAKKPAPASAPVGKGR